jgi:hypothetical protein
MSEQRQAVEFLRRRYAAAILCDDAHTAGRLRVQLDGIMNPAHGAGRRGGAPQPEAARPLEMRAGSRTMDALPPSLEMPAGSRTTARSSGRPEPRLRLVIPVTGLVEGRRGR